MPGSSFGRRSFLYRAGAAAFAAGHIGPFAAQPGAGNSVFVNTHEWHGDLEERLDFPSDWQLEPARMAGEATPALTDPAIRQRLLHPVASRTLRELAEGKKRVVVTFDDLTRPTPLSAVLPAVLEELRAAGVSSESILFLGSFGGHRALTQLEVESKLGPDVARRYAWVNHNPFENVVSVGVTRFKNHIKVNHHFAGADLRICLSGIKPHAWAGYGGGAKAVLPGIAWIESIDYNHSVVLGPASRPNPTAGIGKIVGNEVRADMEEAARLAQVDFSVQVVYNGRRQVVELFAGDVVEAHRAACRYAANHFATPPASGADVVVCNAYPQNHQAHGQWKWAGKSLREGGAAVLIAQSPEGSETFHYWNDRRQYRGAAYWDQPESARPVPQAGLAIYYSRYLQRRDTDRYDPKQVKLADRWSDVVALLKQHLKTSARVVVYPYAPLQHEPLSIDQKPA